MSGSPGGGALGASFQTPAHRLDRPLLVLQNAVHAIGPDRDVHEELLGQLIIDLPSLGQRTRWHERNARTSTAELRTKRALHTSTRWCCCTLDPSDTDDVLAVDADAEKHLRHGAERRSRARLKTAREESGATPVLRTGDLNGKGSSPGLHKMKSAG